MPQCRERCKNQLGKPSGLLVIEKRGAHVVQEASPPPILFQIKTRKKKKNKNTRMPAGQRLPMRYKCSGLLLPYVTLH